MTISHRARVSRAAKFLDENSPGWAYKIRLRELDIESCENCILGQLFGDYDEGMDKLDLYEDTNLYRNPSIIGNAFHAFITSKRYDTLTEAGRWDEADEIVRVNAERVNELWRDEIRTRRGKSGTNLRSKVAA